MFSILLPLEASEFRRAERQNVPPTDNRAGLLLQWLRAVRTALGLNRA
jgi:hypothetical protein